MTAAGQTASELDAYADNPAHAYKAMLDNLAGVLSSGRYEPRRS